MFYKFRKDYPIMIEYVSANVDIVIQIPFEKNLVTEGN